jgi:hypothetical protein
MVTTVVGEARIVMEATSGSDADGVTSSSKASTPRKEEQ